MRKKLPLFLFLHFALIAQLYSMELICASNAEVIEQNVNSERKSIGRFANYLGDWSQEVKIFSIFEREVVYDNSVSSQG